MSQPSQQLPPKKTMDPAVRAAWIGGVFLVAGAIITGVFTIAAIFLQPSARPSPGMSNPVPEVISPTDASPGVSLDSTVTTAPSPNVPTAIPAPPTSATPVATTAPRSYPCDATVSSWRSDAMNVVRDFPNPTAMLRDPIQAGTTVKILDKSGAQPPWYRIATMEGQVLGWIPDEYLTLSVECPHS